MRPRCQCQDCNDHTSHTLLWRVQWELPSQTVGDCDALGKKERAQCDRHLRLTMGAAVREALDRDATRVGAHMIASTAAALRGGV